MKFTVDTDARILTLDSADGQRELDLYTNEAFDVLSHYWLTIGWAQRYVYTFSWMGRPIIQLPEDMVRIQEVIYQVKPDVIIETGVAHGGSLIFYASLCKIIGKGRIVGIDIEIRPHNRQAIEAHELSPFITLVEGSSTARSIIENVYGLVKPGETVLVILDSNHTKAHVREELEAYCELVTPDSYIVATDGIMRDLDDVPRGKPEWASDNPTEAAAEFAATHSEFVLEQPAWPFNESALTANVTHWPGAWLRKK